MAHPDLGEEWAALRDGQFAFAVQILQLYPDHEIYFLARDAELLYDAAVLVAENEKDRERLHLINVSRANVGSPHLKNYLQQEGLSEAALASGQKVLLVDTGFHGTLPEAIEYQFSTESRTRISTQFLVSGSLSHPSSRVFLHTLGLDFRADPKEYTPIMLSYEYLPSFTHRSSEFQWLEGRWEAVSFSEGGSEDGQVSKLLAQKYQEDLRSAYDSFRVQSMIRKHRRLWWDLMRRYAGPQTRAQKLAMFQSFLYRQEDEDFSLREAMVRDVLNKESTSSAPLLYPSLRLSELNLREQEASEPVQAVSAFGPGLVCASTLLLKN